MRGSRFDHKDLSVIIRSQGAKLALDICGVERDRMGVLFIDGRYVDTLAPGQYTFWKGPADARIVEGDSRETTADVSGQEIMTADKVALRVNANVTYRIVDARKAVSSSDDVRQALYRETQLAVPAVIGARELDAFLVTKELIPFIDRSYRTIASRSGRAADGFSMGGCGCLMPALKHPELFSAVCSYGAAIVAADRIGVGPGKRFASREHFEQFSRTALVEKNANAIRKDLKIRMVCGDADSLYPGNVEFTKVLERLSRPDSWVTVPGVGHDTKGLYQRVGLESLRFLELSFDR